MPVAATRVALPDRYRVVRHIANGGMAAVWAAEDEVLSRLVAVKVLSPAYAEEAPARQRFEREARAGAKLGDHPNIVTVFDVGEFDGLPFMVMEYFAAGSVADRLRQDEPIPRPTAIRWLRETASALDHAHRHDVVHRDVKPGNLLLDDRGRLAVGDFGIATVASEASVTLTGQVLGTAAYISPEQAIGQPATPASDRYALAVVAWEVLTGHRPFPGETPAAQARAHVEAPIPMASTARVGLPPAVDEVLERGLAKDPETRPATARALIDELEAALGDDAQPVTAPTRRFLRTGRAAGAGAAAAEAGVAADRAPKGVPARSRPRFAPVDATAVDEAPAATPASVRRDPRTPPPASPAGAADGDGHRARVPLLALLAILALAVGAGAALLSGGSGGGASDRAATSTAKDSTGSAATTAGATTPKATSTTASKGAAAKPQAKTTSTASARTGSSSAQPTQPTQPTQSAKTAPAGKSSTSKPKAKAAKPKKAAATTSSSEDPAALNDQGYSRIQAGDPGGAVPLLQRSVNAYRSRGQTSGLPYAFALYNLGHALRASGNPGAAIPYLEERLRVSGNQRSTVQRELALAKQQAGQG